jgi:hypothetical protein
MENTLRVAGYERRYGEVRKMQPSLLTRIMAEHVEMPGFPQLIVTRGFIYQWLKSLGWDESERGFSSLDYTVFGRASVQAELTDEETRDHYLIPLQDVYER